MEGAGWGFFQAVLGNIRGSLNPACSLTLPAMVLGGELMGVLPNIFGLVCGVVCGGGCVVVGGVKCRHVLMEAESDVFCLKEDRWRPRRYCMYWCEEREP